MSASPSRADLERFAVLAAELARDADLVIIEGVMGLFDGPRGAKGSTADLAVMLGLPVLFTLDCRHLSFVDYSAIAALKTLRERYSKTGKHLRVLHLSERCKKLLKRAGMQHE